MMLKTQGRNIPILNSLYLIFTIVLFCSFSFSVSAQLSASQSEYIRNIKHFNVEDGLSNRQVLSTFQDSRGFIWVGTKHGLNRFDGRNFQVFTKEKHGLTHNEIQQIIEDKDGWLWIFKSVSMVSQAEMTHLSFLNIHTLEVRSVEERFPDFPLKVRKIYAAQSSPNKAVYLGTIKGNLVKFTPNNGFEITQVANNKPIDIDLIEGNRIMGAVIQSDGELMTIHFDTLGNKLWSFPSQKDPSKALGVVYRQGDYAANHFFRWPEANGITLFKPIKKNQLEAINTIIPNFNNETNPYNIYHKTSDNTYWLTSLNSFLVFDATEKVLFDFKKDYPFIFNSQVYRIFFDNQDNIWVSTSDGIYCIQFQKSPFQKYLAQPVEDYQNNTAFSSRGISVIGDKIWINGLETSQSYEIDLLTDKVKALPDEWMTPLDRRMAFKAVLAIDEERLFQAGIGQSIYNTQTQTHQHLTWKGFNLRDKPKLFNIWSLFKNHQNIVWLGTQHAGLAFWTGDTAQIQLLDQYNGFDELQNSTIYSFLEWDNENTLVGSELGIYVLNAKKGIVKRFSDEGKKETYIPQNTIYHLHRDKEHKNNIWAATDGGGLLKLTLNTDLTLEKYEQFTIADGLSSNTVYAVYEDENDNLWIPSEYGIIKMNKLTQSVKAYTESDGIAHNEFNRISHFQDKNGRLYFGGINGITVFHPNDLLDNSSEFDAPLQITKFQQYDGKTDKIIDRTSQIIQNPKIVLRPNDKFFTLKFALLEYQDAKQIRYAYKIEGQDEDWRIIEENNLRISGLPYGNYTLKVKGQGVSGQFSIKELNIPIRVIRPIYLRWWFISLAILGVIIMLYFIYQRRTNALQNRQKVLEKMVNERTETIVKQAEELRSLDALKSRFFANVSHELRTPLTLMLAPIAAALKDNRLSNKTHTHLLLAQKNGQRLNRMINEILDLTKLEANKLELKETKVVWYNFLRNIVSNFESIANSKNIEFQFSYENSKSLQVHLDESKSEIILLNLLSNAFKFTPKNGI